MLGVGLFLLLAVVRWITDNPDLTSSGTFGATLRLAVPIVLAALGGLYAERAGIVNIGLEGMMILGTWFGAWGAWQYGPWWGVAIGIAGGAAGGLLHAIATVTFGVDHIISGVAINILAGGITRYLSVEVYEASPAAGPPSRRGSTGSGPSTSRSWRGASCSGGARPTASAGWRTPAGSSSPTWPGCSRGFTNNLSYLTLIALLLVPAHLVVAVADGVRAAPAVLRREPDRGRLPRRARVPDEVHRAW